MREAFAKEYIVDLKPKEAAIRAGYAKKTASQQANKLLHVPEVQAMIQKEMDKRSIRTGITADGVLNDLREVADMCMGREPMPKTIIVDDKSIDVEVKEVNPAGAIKALELLGKNLKLFTDKVEVDPSEGFREFLAQIAPTIGPPSERGK
jgi:phage terminase small subunit